MAGLNYYAKLPAYETPAGWDTAPLSNALTELRKSREFDVTRDQTQQQINMKNAELGMKSQEFAQGQEDRRVKQIGGIAQYLDQLPGDNPQKAQLWKQLVDHHPAFGSTLQKYGVDPNDHVMGPKFITKEIEGYQDPDKRRLLNAQIEEHGAKSAYYDAHGEYLKTRGDATTMNAETRRLKAYGDIADRLGPNPPQEVFDRENQPGGLIYTAFGGPVSPDQWPRAYQQAQARKGALPEDEALRSRNFSDAQIAQMRRAKDMEAAYGKPKVGYRWDVDEKTGAPVQVLMAEKEDTKQKKIDTAAPFYMKRLDMAASVLGESSMAGRIAASMPGGGALPGVVAYRQAREVSGHAVAALTAMVEGQRHANAQDVRLLKFFQPDPNDTHEMTQFKLNEARQFFKTWMSAKASGRSDEYISNRFSSALQKAYDKLLEEQGMGASEPAKSPNNSGWKIERVR
jgi:hypothetical protein